MGGLHPILLDAAGGEYMDSVLVLEWAVAPGAPLRAGQLLVTVETAKAATEIAAPRAGWLAEIAYLAGSEAPLGAVLGQISETWPPAAAGPKGLAAPDAPPKTQPETQSEAQSAPQSTRPRASPLARRLAARAGLDLRALTGSGPQGRIRRRDVEAALAHTIAENPLPAPVSAPASASAPALGPALGQGQVAPPPLVLLHGFGADRSHFAALRGALPPGLRVVSLDLALHGANASPASSLGDLVDDIARQLAALGHDDIHLAGHSLGGAVALGLAASGQVAIRSLALIAPGGLGPAVNDGFITALAQAETPAALAPWLRQMVADPACLPPRLAERMLAQDRAQDRVQDRAQDGPQDGARGLRAARAALARNLFPGGAQGFDLQGALARVACPLRLIWGREDRILACPPTAALPGHAALHLLAGIGHLPQIECPGLTARLLVETLRSASSEAPPSARA